MPSYGYDGTVTEVPWASMLSQTLGSRYGVFSSADWAGSGVAGVRSWQISAGKGFGWGVADDFSTATTLTLNANSSGTVRYDTVVARRNWSTNSTTFVAVPGGSTATVAAGLNNNPGVLADQPLFIVTVGNGATSLVGVTPIDLRGYPGRLVVAGRQPDNPGSGPMVWMDSDTGDVSLWDGSAWRNESSPPWLTIGHGPNIALAAALKARLVGGVIQFQGSGQNLNPPGYSTPLAFDKDDYTSVGLLPTTFPATLRRVPVTLFNADGVGILRVDTDGTIKVRPISGADGTAPSCNTISLDGVVVPL